MKPILFNTEMVKAILEGRKTVTRRVIKYPPRGYFDNDPPRVKPPYQVNDILYVREAYMPAGCSMCEVYECYGCSLRSDYSYKADFDSTILAELKEGGYRWKPSIHMPKEAARIFLRVTDVRVERLQDITERQAEKEGCVDDIEYCVGNSARGHFTELWDTTIKKDQLQIYGWNANPYVWVIEFE